MSATSAPPVASEFASSAIAAFPPASRSAMMPEPTTATSRNAVPKPSPTRRRVSVIARRYPLSASPAKADRASLAEGSRAARAARLMEFSAAAGRAGAGFRRWNTARALFPTALCFLPVNGNASERVERLPGDSLRILDPVLVRFGIAARGPGLVERRDTGFRDLLAQVFQLAVGFHLESQVVDPGRLPAPRNGEVDFGIVQHPLGVVGLLDARRRTEQAAVEMHALGQIAHGNVNMESFHVTFSFRLRAAGLQTGAQVSPPQQFSIK